MLPVRAMVLQIQKGIHKGRLCDKHILQLGELERSRVILISFILMITEKHGNQENLLLSVVLENVL